MSLPSREPRTVEPTDRDQEQASELRRVREQLFLLAAAARAFRDIALEKLVSSGWVHSFTALLKADDELRDVLLLVARMKRFS